LRSLETGGAKELIAGAVHKLSGRQGEFVAVNVAGGTIIFSPTPCSAIKGELLRAPTGTGKG
jgi:transcriptional regulator of aromatic amino acid metabolism